MEFNVDTIDYNAVAEILNSIHKETKLMPDFSNPPYLIMGRDLVGSIFTEPRFILTAFGVDDLTNYEGEVGIFAGCKIFKLNINTPNFCIIMYPSKKFDIKPRVFIINVGAT